MIKFICNDYNEMSRLAADIVAGQITSKPHCVLGLPAGATPVGMYMELVKKKLNYSEVKIFNLGEYYPIRKKSNQSYYYLLNETFLKNISIKPENIYLFNGETNDPDEECKNFDRNLENAGGLDLIILGVGSNGHIGFNEPAEKLTLCSHVNDLNVRTIEQHAKFFSSSEMVPKQSMTMGIGTIFSAKRILLLANGKNKADAVSKIFSGKISNTYPATLLNLHHDVTIIMDKEAASNIE